MADQTEKRQLDRSEHDVLDLEPVKRKRSCSPSTSHGSESYSALQHASRPRSSTSLEKETALRDAAGIGSGYSTETTC